MLTYLDLSVALSWRLFACPLTLVPASHLCFWVSHAHFPWALCNNPPTFVLRMSLLGRLLHFLTSRNELAKALRRGPYQVTPVLAKEMNKKYPTRARNSLDVVPSPLSSARLLGALGGFGFGRLSSWQRVLSFSLSYVALGVTLD